MSGQGNQKKVSIVGGGLSGLTMAYFLVRKNYQVTVFESAPAVGGILGTTRAPHGLVEHGANAFMASAELEEISRVIGVPLLSKQKVATKRYIFRNGRPRRWPLGLKGSLALIPFIFNLFFRKNKVKPVSGETLADWGEKHLGLGAVKFLLGPAMQGVYGVQPSELSASLLLGPIFSRGMGPSRGHLKGSVAPLGGMQAWIEGLEKFLKTHGCQFVFQEVDFHKNFDHPLVVATSFSRARPWLHKNHFGTDHLETVGLTSVTLHLDESSPFPPPGFGCLFPEFEGFSNLGVLYNHHIFPGRVKDCGSETWISAFDPEKKSESQHLEGILKDRERLVSGPPKVLGVYVHPWPKAIPRYDTALEQWLKDFPGHRNNTFFMGNYRGKIGLSKLIETAKAVSQQIEDVGKWPVTE